jgi:hypothetical protein
MKEESCLPISTTLAELERSVSQDAIQAKSTQSPISISAHMPRESIDLTSQRSASIAISESITHAEESISIRVDFLVRTQVERETEKGLTETSLSSGLNICDVSTKADPDLLSLKTQQDYSIAEWEESCKAYPRSGTMQNGRLSALPCLEIPKGEKGCLSLPTLTTGMGTGRSAGATKLEKWLRDKGVLQNTQSLNPQMMALLSGFPKDWTECLWESPRELEAEMTLEPYLGEPSTSTVQPLFSSESSTSIAFSAKIIDATPSNPLEQLEFLRSERDRMINLGASPQGVWIERSKPAKRDFVQVVWKSSSPRTEWCDRKSRYIGKENSDEHLSAIAQYAAGKKLQAIEKEIKKLES